MTPQPASQDSGNATTSRIPTNLITGFLGSGKTSAIHSLLQHRKPDERWAILINEYGMVSLDHILVNDSEDDAGVQVDELAGGCFCCTLSMALPIALARLIRRTKPHRIILEPTGSGHPAAVIDLLRTGRLAELLELKTTICLIDPRDYENPRITNKEVFRDQIQMADIVAINFTDKCERAQIDRCRQFIENQDPPKLRIAETEHGRLDPAWLELTDIVVRPPQFGSAHAVDPAHGHDSRHSIDSSESVNSEPPSGSSLPQPLAVVSLGIDTSEAPTDGTLKDHYLKVDAEPTAGRPVRLQNEGLGQSACGWIFSRDEVFRRNDLFDLLGSLPLLRLKGVFHCQDDWWSLQRRGSDTRFERTAYRRDSRLELIVDGPAPDWKAIEAQILQCRRS
jgi:G3E family GTPase